MNCCDVYGTCTQGRDCPVHTGVVLPHQAEHAMRVETSCCAPEGGNFYPETLESAVPDVFERIAIGMVITALTLISVGLIAAGGRLLYLYFFN